MYQVIEKETALINNPSSLDLQVMFAFSNPVIKCPGLFSLAV